ncbi:hypothetical protein NQZ68_038021 [Dissostichus eleginoides]|nr:hypothetical protein NQZ68_038021 [Dissostichus eleginoides]
MIGMMKHEVGKESWRKGGWTWQAEEQVDGHWTERVQATSQEREETTSIGRNTCTVRPSRHKRNEPIQHQNGVEAPRSADPRTRKSHYAQADR